MTPPSGLSIQDDLLDVIQKVLQGAAANLRPDLERRMRLAAAELAGGGSTMIVAEAVMDALQLLEVDLRSRRAAMADPRRRACLAFEARDDEGRLRAFQAQAGKWPRALSDALSATMSDIEFAVHNWLRALLDEGIAVIESQGLAGADLDGWLRQRLVVETEAVHRALHVAAREIGERVAASIGVSEAVPPVHLDLEPPAELVAHIRRGPRVLSERQTMATRLVGVLMPAYSGIMIALIVPRFLGLAMPYWLSTAVAASGAIALGGTALAGEKQRQRSRRNSESAAELRSLIDTFRMAVGKRARDGIRAIERQMQAGLSEAVTDQSQRLLAVAEASRRSAQAGEQPEQALAAIDIDLAFIGELRERTRQLSPPRQALPAPGEQTMALDAVALPSASGSPSHPCPARPAGSNGGSASPCSTATTTAPG
ncbi:hypothetical protein ACWT_6132 [Actinoplanes sp. SE50]|uniref:hypothetical protein n=1 Tax=unclassified Actinoplanes TaxID=2626549 RepID=UPI00023ECBC3|nr:hypothetical protein ACPL_6264 [Actinoplanes sp. SE50/110]ATO85547.1 hypothetical protein ACWT_6132 [Actinoplanes sp. SE50]SLM02960.1 hypothetical protein ACSP50_6245 [Actinoplanes sp. SE50/110]